MLGMFVYGPGPKVEWKSTKDQTVWTQKPKDTARVWPQDEGSFGGFLALLALAPCELRRRLGGKSFQIWNCLNPESGSHPSLPIWFIVGRGKFARFAVALQMPQTKTPPASPCCTSFL